MGVSVAFIHSASLPVQAPELLLLLDELLDEEADSLEPVPSPQATRRVGVTNRVVMVRIMIFLRISDLPCGRLEC
jgi:hypothetical protein